MKKAAPTTARMTHLLRGESLTFRATLLLADGAAFGLPEVLMHEGDRHAALADCGGNPLHRTVTHVTTGEDAGHARLQQVRVAVELPPVGCAYVGPGQHV